MTTDSPYSEMLEATHLSIVDSRSHKLFYSHSHTTSDNTQWVNGCQLIPGQCEFRDMITDCVTELTHYSLGLGLVVTLVDIHSVSECAKIWYPTEITVYDTFGSQSSL